MNIFRAILRMIRKEKPRHMRRNTHRLGHWDLNQGDEFVDVGRPIQGKGVTPDQTRVDRWQGQRQQPIPVGKIRHTQPERLRFGDPAEIVAGKRKDKH